MEDKHFLSYFKELSDSDQKIKKQAASKIVNTLILTEALSKSSDYEHLEEGVLRLIQKYLSGDLGEELSADVNYTIKKLISGITTQMEGCTQGYFLTLTLILKRFKEKIDFLKLIKYTISETGANKVQQKSEKKAFALGRLLIISSIIEANIFEISSKKSSQLEEVISFMFSELGKLWNQNSGFRECIIKMLENFSKHLSSINIKPKTLKKLITNMTVQFCKGVLLKTTDEHKSSFDALKYRVENDVDCLTLHLFLSEIISTYNIDLTSNPDIELANSWSIKNNYKAVNVLLKRHFAEDISFKAISRPHICIQYIVKYLANNQDDISKSGILNNRIFGFFSFQYFLDYNVKLETIANLLTSDFMKMWMRNTNRRNKNKIESFANLEDKFKTWLLNNSNSLNENPKMRLELIKKLFGPNSQRRFTLKHNIDLFTKIAEDFSNELIHEFIVYSEDQFRSPKLEEFYSEDVKGESNSEDDKEETQKLASNKGDNIRIYVLNLLVNTVNIFKNHSESSLTEIINFVVYQAFFNESLSDSIKEFSKDKLFSLVDHLHRRKSNVEVNQEVAQISSGLSIANAFLESKSLWISEINKTIGRYAIEGNEFNSLDQIDSKSKKVKSKNDLKIKTHKDFMEFGNSIKKSRKKIYKRIEKLDSSDKERLYKCKSAFKKLIGLEILVFALALFCPVNPDESKEDLEELKICYQKIELEQETEEARKGKRTKTSEDNDDKDKAYQILFDFLISLLTRQNGTLRDITNFTFKAFCSELNEGSLQNMLSIINTPNAEASKILVTEEEALMEMDEDDEGEGEEEEDEEEDDYSDISYEDDNQDDDQDEESDE